MACVANELPRTEAPDELSHVVSANGIPNVYGAVMQLVKQHETDLQRFPLATSQSTMAEDGIWRTPKVQLVPGMPLKLEMVDDEYMLTVITIAGLFRAPAHNAARSSRPKIRPLFGLPGSVESNSIELWESAGDLALHALKSFSRAAKRDKLRAKALVDLELIREIFPIGVGVATLLRAGTASEALKERILVAGYALDLSRYVELVQAGNTREDRAAWAINSIFHTSYGQSITNVRAASAINAALFASRSSK